MKLSRLLPDRTTLAAALSGVLLALAFPTPDFAPLAWVALVPLFVVMGRHPFRSGFTAGLVFFAAVLYWLNIVMTTYGHLHPVLSVVAYLLLCAYLALYFAAATWAACRLRERCGYSFALTLPVLWVGLEFLREFLFSGFPWATLGYSQQGVLPLVQSAELFGVYGLSCLLVLSNAALAELWLCRRAGQAANWRPLFAAGALAAAFAAFGWWRLAGDLDGRDQHLGVAVIQGSIPQDVKWLPDFQRETVAIYAGLTRQAVAAASPGLVIWPEAATPFYFQDQNPLSAAVAALPPATGTALLFGSPAYRRDGERTSYLNSAYLLDQGGRQVGRSDKIHLVPFGEYVPVKRFLPFIDKLVMGIGDFSPGVINPLPLDGHRLGVLVCYEAIFPELARDWVRQRSGLLVNITNDAWFGRSSAPWQHLAMVRFRAVENRVWIARAANTGISAFIAPSGRIEAATELFTPAYAVATVGLGARPGLYARSGDLLPALFLAVGVLWLVQTRRRLR